jgi:hypothetical protein
MAIRLPLEYINNTSNDNTMSLDIYDIETGKLYLTYDIELLKDEAIEILELFNKVLLIKQQDHRAVLYNLAEHTFAFIDNIDDSNLFIYLIKLEVILSYDVNNGTLSFYNTKGELLRRLSREIDIDITNLQYSVDRNFMLIYWPVKINQKKAFKTPMSKGKNRIYNSEESFKSSVGRW